MSLCGLKQGKMIWLLMIIHLGGDPTSVVHAEIGQTFHSEQECIKRIQTITKEEELPIGINLGCVAFKGKGA
jgi:hypothetical protein